MGKGFGLSVVSLCLFQAAALAAPQDGTVLSHQKISRTSGGGGFSLDKDDQFGRAVVNLGDLDGDGIQDIVVGAHGDDDGGTNGNSSNTGAVYVLMLNSDGTVRDRQKISQLRGNFTGDLDDQDQFGRAIGSLGDFDGDGLPDVAVGTAFDDDGGVRRGAIWLLYLNADGTVKEHRKISSTAGGFTGPLSDDDQFGRAVVSLGDLDGNGVTDLAVGAAFDDDGGNSGPTSNVGAVWVLFMNADGTVASHQKISATAGGFTGLLLDGDNFGLSLACLGDLDGDGVADLAVGEPKDADGGHRRGAVWILFMNTDGTVKAQQKISDLEGGFDAVFTGSDEFGTGITTIGDPNGDGVVDLAVGAVLDDEIGDDRGACWILFMNTDGTVQGHQKINALHGNFTGVLDERDWFGSSVAGLHDLDGDGKQDLAVGARFDDDGGANRGAVWMLFLEGQVNAAPVPDIVASPAVGPTPLSVDFSGRSTSGTTSWLWDFGDGGSSTEEDPTHVYTTPGTYDVSLTVTGPGGAGTLTRTGMVATVRPYGCGVNPVDSLTVLEGRTSLGGTLVLGIDNPTGGQAPNSRSLLAVSLAPHANHPCGRLFANMGMDDGPGELLFSLSPANRIQPNLMGERWFVPGEPARLDVFVPDDPGLAGLQVYVQGMLFDPTAPRGAKIGLAGAFELVLSP